MRNIKNGIANVQNVGDVVWSQTVTAGSGSGAGSELDISTYALNDMMHDGILTFDGIFTENTNSAITIKNVIVNEYSTTNLSTMDMRIVLFNDYADLVPVKNSPMAFSTNLILKNIVATADITAINYVGFDSQHQRGVVKFGNESTIKNADNITNLYGLLIYNHASGKAFPVGTEIEIGIVFDIN